MKSVGGKRVRSCNRGREQSGAQLQEWPLPAGALISGGQEGDLIEGNNRFGTMSLLSHHTVTSLLFQKREKKKKSRISDWRKPLFWSPVLPSVTAGTFAMLPNHSDCVWGEI